MVKKDEEQELKGVISQIRASRKKHLEELKASIAEANPDAMLVDGHDNALAGYDIKGRAIYFIDDIIGTLMERDGMTNTEANEFFDLISRVLM